MTLQKPLLAATIETRPFWDACARGELLYQRCEACGRAQFYPRMRCVHCQSDRLSWERSARRGTIYSFTIVRRAPTPAFQAELPYVLALVDLDEGFRMMVNLRRCPLDDVAIGMRVGIVFERLDAQAALPQAVPEGEAHADL